MASLIAFELRKMFTKRVTQVSIGAILLIVAANIWFNLTFQYALDPDEVGVEFEGAPAAAQIKTNADALAGPITDEKATEVLREYQAFINPEGEIRDEFRTDGAVRGERAEEYWKFNATHYAYLGLLTQPWTTGYQMPVSVASTIDTSGTVDLYGQVRAKIASNLDASGTFSYSDAEKDFWNSKAQGVSTPVEYGYAGGWKSFLGLVQHLIFALLAVVITCASIFNGEYRAKTDAVLLSTKFDKSKLGRAKVLAAVIAASAIYWLVALMVLAVPLVVAGLDGAGLPIQALILTNVYDISLAGASLTCCVVGYCATLALLGVVLALSARIDSPMGILAIGVVLVLAPVFVPAVSSSIANHVLYLFPYAALNPNNLFGMVSYAAGPVVIEYPVLCVGVYVVLFVVGVVFAGRVFRRHQVA